MRENDEGNFLGTKTFKFKFSGRSVFKLRNEVATQVDEDMFTITLCVHAGLYGRLTPLVVDLPHSEDPLDIVVLPTSSPGENFAVPSIVCQMFIDHTTITFAQYFSWELTFRQVHHLVLDKLVALFSLEQHETCCR